jgi:hypothetical protein
MNDILPPEIRRAGSGSKRKVRSRHGALCLPQYAHAHRRAHQLFVRGLGEVTDIVEKEMYSFDRSSLNGEHLTLRPEGTAGVVRAVVEHNLLYDGGKRLYYMGPMFRHERPSAGATASSTRSVPRPWALPAPSRCRADFAGACPVEALGFAGCRAWSSTAWASPTTPGAPRA